MMTEPTPTSSEAFSIITAATPALVQGKSRSAASYSIHDARAAASGPSSLTPIAVCPSTSVPALIQSATIGGWSRYPNARACDHTQ